MTTRKKSGKPLPVKKAPRPLPPRRYTPPRGMEKLVVRKGGIISKERKPEETTINEIPLAEQQKILAREITQHLEPIAWQDLNLGVMATYLAIKLLES